jgi:hypothetical protein
MAYMCISEFTQSQTSSASPNSLDYGTQVHLWVNAISVSKCISKYARSRSPSTTLRSDSRYREIQGGVEEVDKVPGSIYSADPRVDRHHLISISSYHTINTCTVSFPTFVLTNSVQDFMDLCNCVDTQCRVVSYVLTRFLRFWMGMSMCSSDYAQLPSVARLTVCIYIQRLK